MTLVAFKYFSLFLCSLYCASKISNYQTKRYELILEGILLSCLVLVVNHYFNVNFYLIAFACYICFIYLHINRFIFTLIIATISFAFSHCLLMLQVFIFSLLLYPIRENLSIHPLKPLTYLSCVCTLFIVFKILSLPRFKSGMPFLFKMYPQNLGLFLSTLIICISTFVYYSPAHLLSSAAIAQIVACFLLIPFIIWWRMQITKSYRQYLRDAETQRLKDQVEQLTDDNQRLAQIVHKDNKLVTAMTSDVLEMMKNNERLLPEEASLHSRIMYDNLLLLSKHRQESLQNLSGNITGQFHTGHMMVDSILHFSQKQAREHGIYLSISVSLHFFDNILAYIDEEQLSHILADLIENAIIATQSCKVQNITVALNSIGSKPSITVADSGVAFPHAVFDKLGIEKCSQHIHNGGSGIGLMDVWQLKKETRATLLIEEFSGAEFTKQMSLIFDNKDRYMILTNRHRELKNIIHRTDIIISNSNS